MINRDSTDSTYSLNSLSSPSVKLTDIEDPNKNSNEKEGYMNKLKN